MAYGFQLARHVPGKQDVPVQPIQIHYRHAGHTRQQAKAKREARGGFIGVEAQLKGLGMIGQNFDSQAQKARSWPFYGVQQQAPARGRQRQAAVPFNHRTTGQSVPGDREFNHGAPP